MILRKPYVLLIKYFRLVHFLLALCVAYSIFKFNHLLMFFNDYLSHQESLIGQNLQNNMFSIYMFLVPIIILICSLFLLWLMIKKKKPFKFYLYNTFIYLFTLIVLMYSYSFLEKMSLEIIDIVSVRVLRDLFIIIIFFQSVSLIVLFVRTIGFDLRSFEFFKDLQQLELSEEDQELYEFDINFDSNERKRKRKKSLRFLKYAFKENKYFIIIVFAAFILIIGFCIFSNFNVYTIMQYEGEKITTEKYDLVVDDTYLVNSSYNGIKITNNYLVVINLKMLSKDFNDSLLKSNFKILIDDTMYSSTNKFDKYVSDIGNVYDYDILSEEFKDFLLVFEIPKEVIKKNMFLIYYENSHKVKIKLEPDFFKTDVKEYNLNDNVVIDNYLNDFNINYYDLNNMFSVNYDYCIDKECYDSVQYLVPSLDTNYDKILIKINVSYTMNEMSIYNNIIDLIRGIGYFEYQIGENIYVSNITNVVNKDSNNFNDLYFEVNDDLNKADVIKLILNTRKCKYIIKFK